MTTPILCPLHRCCARKLAMLPGRAVHMCTCDASQNLSHDIVYFLVISKSQFHKRDLILHGVCVNVHENSSKNFWNIFSICEESSLCWTKDNLEYFLSSISFQNLLLQRTFGKRHFKIYFYKEYLVKDISKFIFTKNIW